MNAREYITELKRISPPRLDDRESLALYTVGLAGEVGEVCEHVKKALWHDKGLNVESVVSEVGDVLWYAARLVDRISNGALTLEDAMTVNVDKLRARHPNGWQPNYVSGEG